jgi:hypothetical protein
MNALIIGTNDKTDRLLELARPGFLLIDDGEIASVFLEQFPQAHVFDPLTDGFNPLKDIDYKRARDLAALLYAITPAGQDTLTARNGRRSLVKLLLEADRLDRLSKHADQEAAAMIDDLLLSPVLRSVLCGDRQFNFSVGTNRRRSIIARLDRAVIGDFDALVLGSLLLGLYKGQVIVPDGGFYLKDMHISLLRQNRLILGGNFLDELPAKLKNAVLLIKDKTAVGCTWEDAQTLAAYARLTPNTTSHSEFVQRSIA